MNVTDLLKRLARESPELVKDLIVSEGSSGYVVYRGVRYEGTFVQVQSWEGDVAAFLKPGKQSPKAPFESGLIPCGRLQKAKIEFDSNTGLFRATIDDKTPCSGDSAYTEHFGELTGVLRMKGINLHVHDGFIEPVNADESWGFHPVSHTRGLQIGYDELVEWKEERKMYFAPADHD